MKLQLTRKKKIFNDPVYGLINFPHGILYDLIDHPFVQRLRRIKQLGLTDYVYSGASHSRFNHCLGALHLMTQAIQSLRWKGVEISPEESEAVSIAILLHDIGHGPFSHALERIILPYPHESISIRVMEILNAEFEGKLSMAISIFKDEYQKKFLHELVASQLDMDRMDYLNRDSFYSGVVEGMIGYERIIKMLNVVNDKLVVEEKGSLSVEQFLMARRMMYWQVYLHKTVLSVEKMLLTLFKFIHDKGDDSFYSLMPDSLVYFFKNYKNFLHPDNVTDESIIKFMELDDSEVYIFLKNIIKKKDGIPQLLSRGIIERHVFKIILKNEPILGEFKNNIRHKIETEMNVDPEGVDYLLICGSETNETYTQNVDEIKLLLKNGNVVTLESEKDLHVNLKKTEKFYLIYPRSIVLNDI
jgi:HD superfamily phosphohydrolase